MSVERFLDTNVLVYAFTGATPEMPKRRRALEIMEEGKFGLSAQVLQEFYVTVTRKAKQIVAPRVALSWIEALAPVPCIAVDAALVKLGIDVALRYRISYWDGAVVAAAQEAGAATLYSEDLSDGQVYGSVRVVNPFAGLR